MIATIETIPFVGDVESKTEIAIEKPRRSRLMRLLADSDLDWRAEACTKLLTRGWTSIHASEDRVTAISP